MTQGVDNIHCVFLREVQADGAVRSVETHTDTA